MHEHQESTGNYEIALANAEKGIASIPCHPGTKIPGVKWKRYQTQMPTTEELTGWFKHTRNNIAILTTGMVVFDVDDPVLVPLVIDHCGDTPHKLQTPRGGVHLGFRRRKGSVVMNQVRIKGQLIDIRTDGGLEMIPHSETEDGRYEWLGEGLKAIRDLPVARIGWTRMRTRRRIVRVMESVDGMTNAVVRARAYVARIEPAVSGQGGHSRTFRVACILIQRFGLTFEQAWPLLCEYSERCQPPWTPTELQHKLLDALKARR